MSKFVCFVDYKDDFVLDGEEIELTRIPKVGEFVSWVERGGVRKYAPVTDIKVSDDEITVQLGRIETMKDPEVELHGLFGRIDRLYNHSSTDELILGK